MKQKILLSLIILTILGCSDTQTIDFNGRQYTFENIINESRKERIIHVIDSILRIEEYAPLNSNQISVIEQDSITKVQLQYNDTARYYLSLDYHSFITSFDYAINNNNHSEVQVVNQDYTYKKSFLPNDSMRLGLLIDYSFGKQDCTLHIKKPVSDQQGYRAFSLSKMIMPYVLADRKSSNYHIYLYKNYVIVDIPYYPATKLTPGLEGKFIYTASLISDSLFQNWDTFIQLKDEKGKIIKSYKNRN